MSAHTVPSAAIVAQKMAERAARAAELVARWEAECAAHTPYAERALLQFGWLPGQPADAAVALFRIASSDRKHEYTVRAAAILVAGRWQSVGVRCSCPDEWGHTWCGCCKHELAARALVARLLAKRGGEPPVPPAVVAARADGVASKGVVLPFPSPADRPAA